MMNKFRNNSPLPTIRLTLNLSWGLAAQKAAALEVAGKPPGGADPDVPLAEAGFLMSRIRDRANRKLLVSSSRKLEIMFKPWKQDRLSLHSKLWTRSMLLLDWWWWWWWWWCIDDDDDDDVLMMMMMMMMIMAMVIDLMSMLSRIWNAAWRRSTLQCAFSKRIWGFVWVDLCYWRWLVAKSFKHLHASRIMVVLIFPTDSSR